MKRNQFPNPFFFDGSSEFESPHPTPSQGQQRRGYLILDILVVDLTKEFVAFEGEEVGDPPKVLICVKTGGELVVWLHLLLSLLIAVLDHSLLAWGSDSQR